jgi:hypothetical protein
MTTEGAKMGRTRFVISIERDAFKRIGIVAGEKHSFRWLFVIWRFWEWKVTKDARIQYPHRSVSGLTHAHGCAWTRRGARRAAERAATRPEKIEHVERPRDLYEALVEHKGSSGTGEIILRAYDDREQRDLAEAARA